MPYSSANVKLYRFKTGKAFTKGQRFALDLPLNIPQAIFDLSSALSFLACAPFKLEPELEIKLEMDSAFAIPVNVEDYDYCIIQADGGTGRVNNLPYFVERIDRVSDQVVRVRLLFDELNFISAIGGDNGIAGFLSDRTRVTREHKDRFALSKTGKSYLPIIDRFPEGISGNFRRTSKEEIEDDKLDWTAFYFADGTDAQAPIASYLVPSESMGQKVHKAETAMLGIRDIPGYVSLYFALPEAGGRAVELWGLVPPSHESENLVGIKLGEEGVIDGRACVVMGARVWTGTKHSDTDPFLTNTYLYKLWYDKNGIFVKEEQVGTGANYVTEIKAPSCARVFSSSTAWPTSLPAILRLKPLAAFFKKNLWGDDQLVAESSIERTSIGLKKAICLPYKPFNRDADGYLPEGCFVVAGKVLLANPDTDNTFEWIPPGRWSDIMLPRLPAKPTETPDGKAAALRDEPKVFSSEFRFAKIVYDSFSIVMKGEESYFNLSLSEIGNDKIVFKFFASPSMVSEFDLTLYSWPGYAPEEFILDPIWSEDYPLHLVINRNNETPVYTSGYLDYLRTGYNYDLKSQAVQLGMQGLGIAISAINAGVGLAATLSPWGLAAAPYAVSAATGFASSIANIGKTAAENERGNAQRLKELQAQGASVAGNSDFAVSKRYTKNRASLETYSVEPRLIDSAREFFYLKGYATDEIKAPNCHTRAHFDFVECDPVFKPEALSLFPKWMLDLIADDLRQGVTFLHQVAGDYDIAQTSSNYEISVLYS